MKSRNMDFILRKTLKLYYHFGVYTKSGKYPTECQTFIKGFKLGARFVIACFENENDIFDE